MKIHMALYSSKSSRNPVRTADGEADVVLKSGYSGPLLNADASLLRSIERNSAGAVSAFAFIAAEMIEQGTDSPLWKGCRPTAVLHIASA